VTRERISGTSRNPEDYHVILLDKLRKLLAEEILSRGSGQFICQNF
jgi:hypothetical protein